MGLHATLVEGTSVRNLTSNASQKCKQEPTIVRINLIKINSEITEVKLRGGSDLAQICSRKPPPQWLIKGAMKWWDCKDKITLGEEDLIRNRKSTNRSIPGVITRVHPNQKLVILIINSIVLAGFVSYNCRRNAKATEHYQGHLRGIIADCFVRIMATTMGEGNDNKRPEHLRQKANKLCLCCSFNPLRNYSNLIADSQGKIQLLFCPLKKH